MMASKLETFLADNKIDHRRLLGASRQLERLRPADRRIKLIQKQARKKEDAKKPEGLDKPRSGRKITVVGLRNACEGKNISGNHKTRILRAVNNVLEGRKKKPVGIEQLFDVPATPIAKPKPPPEAPAADAEAPADK